uniref:Death domain-containing protein n=1 Tax=Macrostomum lignano TaxID=282301 RepID=A0A1I8IG69_9PLAT
EATRLAAEVNRLQEWQRLTREKILINCPEWAMAGVPPNDPDRPLDCLIWAAQHPPSAESRLVDLETRVTQLGGEFSRCAGRCLLYEGVLEELLRSRLGPDQVHEVISDTFLATGKSVRDALDRKDGKDPRQLTSMSENAVQAVTENQDPSALLDAAFPDRSNVLTLKPPAQRLPGCTPISQMNRDLRQWICLDLNMERRAGNDWRMLADRLGFADSVPAWSGLASPMAKLLTEWSRSESATVRLLHRHLASPELRSPLLAKRLQQFYRVD